MGRAVDRSRARRLAARTGKVLLWIGISAAVLAGAAVGILHTDWGRDILREQIVDSLGDRVDGTVTIERMRGSIFGDPVLDGVSVRDRDGREAIHIDSLAIDYSVTSLLGDQIEIESIEVTGPRIAVWPREDGTINLAGLWRSPAPEAAPPPTVAVESISLSDGAIEWTDRRGGTVTLQAIDLEIADLFFSPDRASAELESLAAHWTEVDRQLAASGRVSLRGPVLTVDLLRARMGRSSAVATEPVVVSTDLSRIDGTVSLDVRAADVNAVAPALAWRSDLIGEVELGRQRAEDPIAVDMRVQAAEGQITVDAEVVPAPLSVDGHLRVSDLDPAALTARGPSARISADVDVALAGADPSTAVGHIRGSLSGSYAGYELEDSSIDVGLVDAVAAIDASLQVGESRATIDGRVRFDDPAAPVFDSLVVEARTDEIADFVPPSLGLSGSARIAATIDGPLKSFRVRGTAEGEDLRREDIRVGEARVSFAARGLPDAPVGSVEVQGRDVVRAGERIGVATVSAHLRRGGRIVDVEIEARGAEPDAPSVALRGRVDLGELDGDVGVSLERARVTAGGTTWRAEDAEITITEGGDVRTRGLTLRSEAGEARVSGSLSTGLAIDVRDMELAAIGQTLGLESELGGRIDVEGELRGSLDRLHGSLVLRAEDVRLRAGAPPLSALARIDLGARSASVDGWVRGESLGRAEVVAEARAPDDPLDVDAWRRAGPGALRRVEARLRNVQVGPVLALLEVASAAEGRVYGSLEVGDRAGTAELRLTLIEGGYEDRAEEVTAYLTARSEGARVEARAGAEMPGAGQLSAEGTVRLADPMTELSSWTSLGEESVERARIELKDADLAFVASLVPELAGTEGQLAATATVIPASRQAEVEANAVGLRPRGLGRGFDVRVAGTLGTSLTADLSATVDEKRVLEAQLSSAAGYGDLRRRGLEALRRARIDGRVRSEDLPLSLVSELAGRPPSGRIRGVLGLDARVAGTVQRPEGRLSLDLSDARFGAVGFERFTFEGSGSRAQASGTLVAEQRGEGRLALSADVDFERLGELDLGILAEKFDLRFLGVLARETRSPLAGIAGTLDAELAVRGTIEAPDPSGWLKLRDGRVRLPGGLQPLTQIELDARTDEQRLITSLNAQSGGGVAEARLEARLDTEGAPRAKGHVSVRDVPYFAGGSMLSITGEADLSAKRSRPAWSISTDILDATVTLPESGGRELHELDDLDDVTYVEELSALPTTEVSAETTEPLIRLEIAAPETIEIRSPEVVATVEADLDVTVTPAGNAVSGTASVTRGRVDILDRRYEILVAEAAFDGQIPPNPQLNVRLRHDFETLQLTIAVTGTLEEPDLNLIGNPPLYDEATLLAIVLGRRPGGPETESGLEGRALALVSSYLLDQVRGAIGEILPIDVLRVQTTGEDTSQITAGKWITDDLFVAYQFRTEGVDTDDNVNEAVIEYRLTRSWLVEGTYGDRGAGGVDLLWVNRY